MKIFSSFERLCLRQLKDLERDFGFKIAKVERESYGVFITYTNATTFLRVSFEPREGGVFVSVGRLVSGRIPPYEDTTPNWFDFRDLLAVRDHPHASFNSGQWPPNEKLEAVLSEIANALKSHAVDVLQGDFSVFRQLDQIVKERVASARLREG